MTQARRRGLLALAALPAMALPGCGDSLRLFNKCASRFDPGHRIDPAFLARAWRGLEPSRVMDMHVHVAGSGPGPADPWINPRMRSARDPFAFAHFALMANAACIRYDPATWSARYLERMDLLVGEFPQGAKLLLLALDGFRDASGALDRTRTIFTVPDAYVSRIARARATRYAWAASIHPYRDDALEALGRAAEEGAIAVKWIPYFMGIDPAAPRCRPFFRALARLGLPLISHAGWQHELVPGSDQEFGNPLRLRAALDEGATVIASHCGMQGDLLDTEHPVGRTLRPSFELFVRLLDSPAYAGRLYGDLSATVIRGREGGALRRLLTTGRWHSQLLNGSDYPGPGILPVMTLRSLVEEGLLGKDDAEKLAHVQHHNPLLFDFLVKRSLSWRGARFPAAVFETRRAFPAATRAATGTSPR